MKLEEDLKIKTLKNGKKLSAWQLKEKLKAEKRAERQRLAAIERARPKRPYKKRAKKFEKTIDNSQNNQIELVTNKFLDGGDNLTKVDPKLEEERGASFYLNDNERLNVRNSPQRPFNQWQFNEK